jgi:hypothetical protein
MSANILFESDGAIATSILPTGGLGNPSSAFFQVAPPSRVMYTPLPSPPLNIAHVWTTTCHVPAMSTLGSLASIEMPEQPVSGLTNSTRSQVSPPLVVRYTPRSC